MRRTRLEKQIIENVSIVDFAHDGRSVGKTGELVLFVENTVPGDVVDVEVKGKKKSFFEGVPSVFHHYSEDRVTPFCDYFGICGGCKWQHLNYSAQLKYKQKQVNDAMQRIAKVVDVPTLDIIPSESDKFYRNKLEFTFSDKRWFTNADYIPEEQEKTSGLGFHVGGRFDKIVDVEKCWLQTDPSNQIRNFCREYAYANELSFYNIRENFGFLRNLIIRTSSTGELMVLLILAEADQENIFSMLLAIKNKFPEITSLLYCINTKKNDTIFDQEILHFFGNEFILEEMKTNDGISLKYKIGPKSFYQTNSKQAEVLYKKAVEMADISKTDLVYDLYTGAGTIANFVAQQAKEVIGIEYVADAIEDAKENSALNNISNTRFFAGDMKDMLTIDFMEINGKPDIIITDPPRAGMHADVCERLAESGAKKIIYISCNPATQARDLIVLMGKYKVEKIQPVDMFPHTQHVENIVLLSLKKYGE